MEPFSSIGGAPFRPQSKKVIRLILQGCANRPFFHISVQEISKTPQEPVIEQVGNYDPLPNAYNEKLVAINFQRLEYWLRKGAEPTQPVQKLLGLCGYFPVHAESFKDAYRRRKEILEELEKLKIEAAKFSSVKEEVTEKSELSSDSSSSSGDNETSEKEESASVETDESQSSDMPDEETPKK